MCFLKSVIEWIAGIFLVLLMFAVLPIVGPLVAIGCAIYGFIARPEYIPEFLFAVLAILGIFALFAIIYR